MKKIIFALLACAALAGCNKDEGGDFVGVWKNSDKLSETLTVTKVNDGYRAVAKIDKDKQGFMDVESVLTAESDTVLTTQDKQKALELAADGKLTSFLRNKADTFTKVN